MMAAESESTSPLSSTSAGMRPSGFLARTSARLSKPDSARCSNAMPYALSVIATRRV